MNAKIKKTKCLVCKKTTSKILGGLDFNNKGYHKNSQLVECVHCGFSFVLPYPNEKEIYKIYSKQYHYQKKLLLDSLYSFILDHQNRKDVAFMSKYGSKGKVLDIGAGRGDILALLDNSWEKWAFDPYISKSDKNILKSKIGDHVNDHAELRKYPQNSFDLIILRNVIEHTLEFNDLIKSISKLLKRGGCLFIRTPNTDSVDYKILINNWWVLNMPGHMAFFGKNSIDKLLQNHNLKLTEIVPDIRSSILSFYRSKAGEDKNMVSALISSILYSYLSRSLGEGGDMILIAQR